MSGIIMRCSSARVSISVCDIIFSRDMEKCERQVTFNIFVAEDREPRLITGRDAWVGSMIHDENHPLDINNEREAFVFWMPRRKVEPNLLDANLFVPENVKKLICELQKESRNKTLLQVIFLIKTNFSAPLRFKIRLEHQYLMADERLVEHRFFRSSKFDL